MVSHAKLARNFPDVCIGNLGEDKLDVWLEGDVCLVIFFSVTRHKLTAIGLQP
jgi:hypothetical protein